jgi:hypothetical protein
MCTADPCMFIWKDCIVQLYVDDVIWYSQRQSTIDDLMQSFKDDGDEYNWEMTIEGTDQEFLVINIDRIGNTWELMQTGLIQAVLKAAGMEDCNAKPTPGSGDGKPLESDKNGIPARESWNYASLVGMLLYLTQDRTLLLRYTNALVLRTTQKYLMKRLSYVSVLISKD